MADHVDTEVLALDSQSPLSSSVNRTEIDLNGECPEFQDTVLYDDTMVLDSPVVDSRWENVNDNTQVADCWDCDEEVRLEQVSECEDEVVVDSEDEDGRSERVNVVHVVNLQKRNVRMPGEMLANLSAEFDASNDQECQAGNNGSALDIVGSCEEKDPAQMIADDHDRRLNLMESQEPGESTQANALDFVDHFVMDNILNLSPGVDPTKILRMKSPPVRMAKGPESLAKRIKTRTPIKEKRIYDWVDDGQHGGSDPILTRSKATSLISQEGHSSADGKKEEKRSLVLRENTSKPTHLVSSSVKNSLEESCGTEQVSEMNLENMFITQMDEQLQDEISQHHTETREDLLDVGINTQIAAEAMGALLYVAPACWSTNNDNEGPGNTVENFQRDPMKRKANESGRLSFQKSPRSYVGSTGRKSNRKVPVFRKYNRGSPISYDKNSDNSDLVLGLASIAKSKGSKSLTTGMMNGRSSIVAPKSSSRSSCKFAEHRNSEATDNRISKEIEAHPNPSTLFELDSLEKGLSKATPIVHQFTQPIPGCTVEISRDQFHNQWKRTDNVMENGFQTHNGKRMEAAVAPSEIWGARRKRKVIPKEKPGTKLAAKMSFFNFDEWNYPKGKRSCLMQRHYIAASKPQFDSSTVGETESSTLSDRGENLLTDNDKSARYRLNYKEKTQSVCNGLFQQSFETDSDKGLLRQNSDGQASNTFIRTGKLQGTDSSLLIVVENNPEYGGSSRKNGRTSRSESNGSNNHGDFSNVASSSWMPDGYHKSPCNKNLPRSSLLKELIRLGAPGKLADFTWKDLRRRRNMAYVRVLFSQHLDDHIIKKQKKTVARLGISVASSSTDATHFIADKFVRTRNMLEAMALGKPVVTHLWLESCGQASCLIDEKCYILKDSKKEKEIGFCMSVSLARASQVPLLKGLRVFITPNTEPEREMIASLVKAAHGQVVERSEIIAAENGKIPDDLLILSCEEDREICLPYINRGSAVYSSELLLNGIVIQKLEYERHRLFINGG